MITRFVWTSYKNNNSATLKLRDSIQISMTWYGHLCRELVCITVKWTWYNGHDLKRCKSVDRTIFLNSFNFFLNIHLKLTNHRYCIIKKHYFPQFITKMGFCCKILSVNDLTPSPISRLGTHCWQWQRANERANLSRAFSLRNQHRAKALYWKSVGRKRVLVMLGYHSIQRILSI